MILVLKPIDYRRLNSRQKENYNYQKVSAVLADYGFMTIRLSDDWAGADFIAHHVDGDALKVQLKGRLLIAKKYQGKDLWICFPYTGCWYLYPHDLVAAQIIKTTNVKNTESWIKNGLYSFPSLGEKMSTLLKPYRMMAHQG